MSEASVEEDLAFLTEAENVLQSSRPILWDEECVRVHALAAEPYPFLVSRTDLRHLIARARVRVLARVQWPATPAVAPVAIGDLYIWKAFRYTRFWGQLCKVVSVHAWLPNNDAYFLQIVGDAPEPFFVTTTLLHDTRFWLPWPQPWPQPWPKPRPALHEFIREAMAGRRKRRLYE